jgi:hypothetical protein
MNNGQSMRIKFAARLSHAGRVKIEPINDTTWPGLAPYQHRMITAAQNDRTLRDSHLYIFLTDNEYITYNIPENKVADGPTKVSESSWASLLRDPEPEPVISDEILPLVNFGVASSSRPIKK